MHIYTCAEFYFLGVVKMPGTCCGWLDTKLSIKDTKRRFRDKMVELGAPCGIFFTVRLLYPIPPEVKIRQLITSTNGSVRYRGRYV